MQNGLMVLHSNRLETLTELVADWLARQPLSPLETETFLVQSNGMAQWLKLQLADALGISAGFQFQMPARFLWSAYRTVLGEARVPRTSPFAMKTVHSPPPSPESWNRITASLSPRRARRWSSAATDRPIQRVKNSCAEMSSGGALRG